MKTSPSLSNSVTCLNRIGPVAAAIPQLFYLTDDAIGADPLEVANYLPRGCGIIFRHYSLADRERLALAGALARICRKRRLKLLIANDIRLAIRVRADGIHVPDYNLWQIPRIRAKLGTGRMITAATHSLQRVRMAGRMKADAAIISPVFPTRSHKAAPGLGVLHLRMIVKNSPLPLIALGGISGKSLSQLRNIDLHGVGAIRALEVNHQYYL